MARSLSDSVEIIGVGGRDTTANMARFVERHDLHHVRQIADESGEVWARFGIVGQPAWVFIDGETGEQRRQIGALGAAGLQQGIEDLAG